MLTDCVRELTTSSTKEFTKRVILDELDKVDVVLNGTTDATS